jgi:hypothetical protein
VHIKLGSQSESESESLYDWRFTAKQFALATSSASLTTSNFNFQLKIFCHSPYVTSSLRRGCVYPLQFLLVLASVVILRSESSGTHNHILLPQIRDSPNLKAWSSYLYPPGTGWPNYTPRHWVPLQSPPATHRATMEEFEPTFKRACFSVCI